MLSRDDVVFGYRYVLDREPESEAVIETYLATVPDVPTLRRLLIGSDEFKSGLGAQAQFYDTVTDAYWAPPRAVEADVAASSLVAMAERIRREWARLGETEPYWGVLTDERYKADRIDGEALADFRESGRLAASLIDLAIRRGLPARPSGRCVELGCGVGRITRHLAEKFDELVGLDIAPGNLSLCDAYLRSEGVTNVSTLLVRTLSDLDSIGEFDWFFSVIVLQHNPPPVQAEILRVLLSKLRPGGGFVFQTMSDKPGYEFQAAEYLASEDAVMEVHALPQSSIFAILRDAGLELSAVRMDPWTGGYGSYTYEGYRPV